MTFLFIALAVTIASFLTLIASVIIEAIRDKVSMVCVRTIYISGFVMLFSSFAVAIIARNVM